MALDDPAGATPNFMLPPANGFGLSQQYTADSLKQQGEQVALQQQRLAIQRQAQMRADLVAMSENPTSKALLNIGMKYPEFGEHFSNIAKAVGEREKAGIAAQVVPGVTAALKGDLNTAIDHLSQVRDGYTNTDQPDMAKGAQYTIDQLKGGDKAGAIANMSAMGIAAMGEKGWDAFLKSTTLGPDVEKAQSAATEAAASATMKTNESLNSARLYAAAADQKVNEARASGSLPAIQAALAEKNQADARLATAESAAKVPLAPQMAQGAVDLQAAQGKQATGAAAASQAQASETTQNTVFRQEMQPNTMKKQQADIAAVEAEAALKRFQASALPENLQAPMIEASQKAAQQSSLATKALGLAHDYTYGVTGVMRSGLLANIATVAKEIYGGDNAVSTLRKEFNQLRQTMITASQYSSTSLNRPNETLLDLLKSGVPEGNAEPSVIAEWLNKVGLELGRESHRNNVLQDWVSQSRGNVRAMNDMSVDSRQVKKGELLGTFLSSSTNMAPSVQEVRDSIGHLERNDLRPETRNALRARLHADGLIR